MCPHFHTYINTNALTNRASLVIILNQQDVNIDNFNQQEPSDSLGKLIVKILTVQLVIMTPMYTFLCSFCAFGPIVINCC